MKERMEIETVRKMISIDSIEVDEDVVNGQNEDWKNHLEGFVRSVGFILDQSPLGVKELERKGYRISLCEG